jgi:colicin import membrane protein
MTSNTTYNVNILDADGAIMDTDSRSRKDAAITLAEKLFAENPGMTVTIVTDAGTEVQRFEVEANETETPDEDEVEQLVEAGASEEVVAEAVSRRAKPWTKAVTTEAFEAPEREGMTLAYVRARTATGVYRKDDKSGWVVLDTRDNTEYEVENTAQARTITNRLEAELKAKNLEIKAAAAEAKATAKAEKAAARAVKLAADTEAKEARKAARAEAKAVRDAEAAQAKAEREAAKAAKAEAPAEDSEKETVNA